MSNAIQGVQVFYGPNGSLDTQYKITPSPQISINYAPIYNNDTIIGFTNIIRLNGFISQYIQTIDFTYQGIEEPAVAQSFKIQNSTGPEIVAVESGSDIGVYTEDNNIVVISFGTDDGRSGTVTISISSPAIFTKENHGLNPGDIIYLNTNGQLPGGLEVATPYYVLSIGLTKDTFIVSNTPDGAPINTFGTQSGEHSMEVENDPEPSWNVTNTSEEKTPNVRKTLGNVNRLRSILNNNGSTLTVKDKDNNIVLSAVGGILRSLSFDEGSNSWTQTLPFSCEMEFSYIQFFGENLACATYWDSSTSDLSLIDQDKYPLKSFNDSWSVNIDPDSFNFVNTSDSGQDLKISNNTITISYSISATGKNYYKNSSGVPEFKPGWEIAKHFAQERLYDQVTALISGIVNMSPNPCNTELGSTDSLLSATALDYSVFNETINCSFSELEGSFSASYNSILKKKSNNNNTYDDDHAKHTVSKSITHTQQSKAKLNTSISINGTIEGLVLGGLVNLDKFSFSLPRNGSLLIKSVGDPASKYDRAYNLWQKLTGNDDISTEYKNALGVNNSTVGVPSGCPGTTYPPSPLARSFNLTKNMIDGTIEYSVEYNNECFVANSEKTETVKNISIDYANSVPVFAEFVLPSIGTVLQDINTVTAKEIAYTITGRDDTYKIDRNFSSLLPSFIISIANIPVTPPSLLPGFPDYEALGFVVKNKSQDINPMDGTYTIKLTYACVTGCPIL